MGSILKGPSIPGPDPELVAQRKAEEERLAKEQQAAEAAKADKERKQRANLLGQRSLQEEDISGFGGFRRMGTTKSQGKSIRS